MDEKRISSPPALRREKGEDLISKLPDEVIHRIFSFMDMVDVVPTCVLSKRWRYLWTSLPFLNFDYYEFFECRNLEFGLNEDNEQLFVDFVNKVLSLRNESSDIHTFRLQCKPCYRADDHVVARWIHFAVLRKVEVLEVDIDSLSNLHHDVVTSKVLRTLKLLCAPQSNLPIFNPPDSACLPNLKNMHLDDIVFEHGESISSLISRCPLLETLSISCWLQKTKAVIISALQLQHLVISLQPVPLSDHCQVTIFAPKLLSFTCDDCAPNDYSFANVSSLVRAEIKVSYHPSEAPGNYANNIASCLRGLASVKSLVLSLPRTSFEGIFLPAGVESMLAPFHNLNFLKLDRLTSMDEICAATRLLKICPSLEKLVLSLNDAYNYHNIDEGLQPKTADMFAHCVLPHLKHVEIQNVVGKEAEFKLIQYLLNNAKRLKKMVLRPA